MTTLAMMEGDIYAKGCKKQLKAIGTIVKQAQKDKNYRLLEDLHRAIVTVRYEIEDNDKVIIPLGEKGVLWANS